MEKRRRHQSLTTVDVESATVLRRCQSPRYGRPSVSSSRSASSVNETSSPTLLPSFGETSKEFHLARVTPDEQEGQSVAPVTTKRRESAPDLNGTEPADSRPRIIIRLTSVDGLELSLSSPIQDNLLQPISQPGASVRTIRVGAARPQNSSKFLPFLDCLFVCFFLFLRLMLRCMEAETLWLTGRMSKGGQFALRRDDPTTRQAKLFFSNRILFLLGKQTNKQNHKR